MNMESVGMSDAVRLTLPFVVGIPHAILFMQLEV